MPSRAKLRKKWFKVAQALANRDTNGVIKCSIPSCPKSGKANGLIMHHRFKPSCLSGKGQYAILKDCEGDLDNCELLCKFHVKRFDKISERLWELHTEGYITIEQMKEMYLQEKQKVESEYLWNKVNRWQEKAFLDRLAKEGETE